MISTSIHILFFFFFFFSSRRRHTRWNCDWSSDVCSSDLDRCDATTDIEEEKNRQRQLVLAEISDRLPDVFFIDFKILATQTAKNFARFLVDDLRVKHHQIGIDPDDAIWIDVLCPRG